MIKAYIFDMDGVIVDSEAFYFNLRMKFLKDAGIKLENMDINNFVGLDSQEEWKIMIPNKNLREKLLPYFLEYEKQYKIDYSLFLNQSVPELLEDLTKAGKKIALASSSSLTNIQQMICQCHLSTYFDVVVSGEEVKKNKPASDIYMKTIQKLSLKPNECVAVEDSKIGILAAKKAGIETWAISNPKYNLDQRQADCVYESIGSLKHFFNNNA